MSARYFYVELLTGTIWCAIWWQYLVVTWHPAQAVAYAAAASALVAVIFIDWEFYIIPDQINAFLLFVGFAYNGYLYYVKSPLASIDGIPSSIIGGLTGVAVLWGIALLGRLLFGKDAMGHGDIKMARGVGAILLPLVAVMSFGIAVFLGAVLGIAQILYRNAQDKKHPIEEEVTEEEEYVPESIGSLCKSGFGYFTCIDVLGLFLPKLYISWFGEDPFEPVVGMDGEQDDFSPSQTMIPFGPYLALGAIVATVFEAQLRGAFNEYWRSIGGN